MSRSKLRLVVFLSIAAAAASSASAESARTAAPPSRDLVRIDASDGARADRLRRPGNLEGGELRPRRVGRRRAAAGPRARDRLRGAPAADRRRPGADPVRDGRGRAGSAGLGAAHAVPPGAEDRRGHRPRVGGARGSRPATTAVPIGREPRGWEDIEPRAVNCNSDPLVGTLLGRMDSARWMDWIEKISGIEPVEVAGVSAPITSRHSSRLFTGHAHARGFDFLQQQVASWHYGPGPATIEARLLHAERRRSRRERPGRTWS